MKKLIFLFFIMLTNAAVAQSSKSVEVPDDTILREDQRHQLELREEQRVREEWDREEQEARALEERRRIEDEEQAENGDLPSARMNTQRRR